MEIKPIKEWKPQTADDILHDFVSVIKKETEDEMDDKYLKLSCEIFVLALLINERTDYCVFLNYAGHVDSIDIRLMESKENYNERIFETEIKTNFLKRHSEQSNDPLAFLKSQRDVMKYVLEENELPYDELEEHIEQKISYYL